MSCIVVLSPKKEKKEETIMNRFSKKKQGLFLGNFYLFCFFSLNDQMPMESNLFLFIYFIIIVI